MICRLQPEFPGRHHVYLDGLEPITGFGFTDASYTVLPTLEILDSTGHSLNQSGWEATAIQFILQGLTDG